VIFGAARLQIAGVFGGYLTLGTIAVAAAARPWLPLRHRPAAVLIASIAVAAMILRWFTPVAVASAILAVRTARLPWPTSRRLAVLLGTWLIATAIGWLVLRAPHSAYLPFAGFWGCLPPALIWLVLDNDSGELEGVPEREQWTYLLALPRFAAPFLQPIGAARFVNSQKLAASPKLAARGLALGLYACVVFYALKHTHFSAKSTTDVLSLAEHGPRIARNIVHIYAYNAGNIFLAVAILRVLGYDLGSGFNWPTLSASPAEFFRRWNYYFFEFANRAIFLPLVSRLRRRRLPVWAAYGIGAYASFALGVWGLDHVSRLPASYLGISAYASFTNPHELRVHFAMWTLAISGQLLLLPLRRFQRRVWWRVVGNAYTWAVVLAGIVALFVTRNRLY
jgi:hypothetical protein